MQSQGGSRHSQTESNDHYTDGYRVPRQNDQSTDSYRYHRKTQILSPGYDRIRTEREQLMSGRIGEKRRAAAWVKGDPFGVEFAEIALAARHVAAEGVAIAARPIAYRLDYVLETAPGYLTSRLWVTSRGEGWRRTLDLRRHASGVWTVSTDEEGRVDLPPAGGDPATFTEALDCDLGLSPVTNLMPILRHKLLAGGGPVELTMANDLPVMLLGPRAHAWVSDVLLYLLDEHSYTPETIDPEGHKGIWIAGAVTSALEWTRMVWPSGSALATEPTPIAPPPPARFSMMMGWPTFADTCSNTVRGSRSVALPGENGTMT